MKVRNKRIYSENFEYLKTIRQEYTDIGFDTSFDSGVLTVYALKRKRKKVKPERRERRDAE